MRNETPDNNFVITIDLNPDLHDFMIHEFGEDENGCIKINKRKELGKYIDSMWLISDLPVKRKFEKYNNPVKFILPVCEDSAYTIRTNYIYIPLYREQQINDQIESVWKLTVREYFCTGYERGYRSNQIIEAILKAFNIKKNQISFDRIKKMDYRNRKNIINLTVKEIQTSLFQ
jgi:hypothetical protein